jgi:hypothetical protein
VVEVRSAESKSPVPPALSFFTEVNVRLGTAAFARAAKIKGDLPMAFRLEVS